MDSDEQKNDQPPPATPESGKAPEGAESAPTSSDAAPAAEGSAAPAGETSPETPDAKKDVPPKLDKPAKAKPTKPPPAPRVRNRMVDTDVEGPNAAPPVEAPKQEIARPPARLHRTYAKVIECAVMSDGKIYEPGDIHDFPNSDIESLPHCFEKLD